MAAEEIPNLQATTIASKGVLFDADAAGMRFLVHYGACAPGSFGLREVVLCMGAQQATEAQLERARGLEEEAREMLPIPIHQYLLPGRDPYFMPGNDPELEEVERARGKLVHAIREVLMYGDVLGMVGAVFDAQTGQRPVEDDMRDAIRMARQAIDKAVAMVNNPFSARLGQASPEARQSNGQDGPGAGEGGDAGQRETPGGHGAEEKGAEDGSDVGQRDAQERYDAAEEEEGAEGGGDGSEASPSHLSSPEGASEINAKLYLSLTLDDNRPPAKAFVELMADLGRIADEVPRHARTLKRALGGLRTAHAQVVPYDGDEKVAQWFRPNPPLALEALSMREVDAFTHARVMRPMFGESLKELTRRNFPFYAEDIGFLKERLQALSDLGVPDHLLVASNIAYLPTSPKRLRLIRVDDWEWLGQGQSRPRNLAAVQEVLRQVTPAREQTPQGRLLREGAESNRPLSGRFHAQDALGEGAIVQTAARKSWVVLPAMQGGAIVRTPAGTEYLHQNEIVFRTLGGLARAMTTVLSISSDEPPTDRPRRTNRRNPKDDEGRARGRK